MKILSKLFSRLRAETSPFRFLLSRLLWMTGLCRFFSIKYDNYRLKFHPSALSCALWVDAKARKSDDDFILHYVKEDDCIIDIGANIGSIAIPAAISAGTGGQVYAFEPHPKTFHYLNYNIALNKLKNVMTFNVGLGNKNTEVNLSNDKLDDMNHIVSDQHAKTTKVKLAKLDDIVEKLKGTIALIKIDVEGYEKFILEGATEVLKRTECIYFESSEDHFKRYGYSSRDLFHFLRQFNFDIYEITNDNRLAPIPHAFVSTVGQDLIAIKDKNNFKTRTGYAFAVR